MSPLTAVQLYIILLLVLGIGIAIITQHPGWFDGGCTVCF